MTEPERTILRRLIDARRRQRENMPADGIPHGTENAYKRHGCRCNQCRAEANRRRTERRRRQISEGRVTCRANYTSYKLGCKCWNCVSAGIDARRRERQRKLEAA